MKVLVFGDILWDRFPERNEIGGAAFNFAAHMERLCGSEDGCVYFVSALGEDELGDRALEYIRKYNISQKYIIKTDKPTGVTVVSLDSTGTPNYDIVKGVSYDYITLPDGSDCIEKVKSGFFDAIYIGTLPQRNSVSRETVSEILSAIRDSQVKTEVFCDINIRQKYYTRDIVKNCLDNSSVLKVSRDERAVFSELSLLPCGLSCEETCRMLCDKYSIHIVIMTLDSDGAMLYSKDTGFIYSEKPVCDKVVSTVGGGDSFSACFLYNALRGETLEKAINKANKLSSFVVTRTGAIPDYSEGLLESIT